MKRERIVSPLPYPGSKYWLLPTIFKWLKALPSAPSTLIEPFAGSAIVGLTAAHSRIVEHVVLGEGDPLVAAIWNTIFNDEGGANWLAAEVASSTANKADAYIKMHFEPLDGTRRMALWQLLNIRARHGRRPALSGTSYRTFSRRFTDGLITSILEAGQLHDRVRFIESDALALIRKFKRSRNVAFYLDPPYPIVAESGKPLYRWPGFGMNEHDALRPVAEVITVRRLNEKLFKLAATIPTPWLMSNEDSAFVRGLAAKYNFDVRETVPMMTHHRRRTHELLIGRGLKGLRLR